MPQPLLSIIIVNYNVKDFLNQALDSLQKATSDLEVEVFVVDNASRDGSVNMVKSSFPNVRLIENKKNIGFAGANNQAISQAIGKYLLFMNPDTIVQEDTLQTMIQFFSEHEDAGMVGCKIINPDGSLQLACRRSIPTPWIAFTKLVGLAALFPKSKLFGKYNLTYIDPDKISTVDAVSGSFMMVRREVLNQVGSFDDQFFMYGEDLDICYRIKQAGWKIYYVPYTEIIHFKGESTKTVPTLKSIRDFYTAMHIFVDKHYNNRSKKFLPQWLLITGIYGRLAWASWIKLVKGAWQPLTDLFLLNVSLILGILLRFGITLENAPDYSGLQWISIFVVYSVLYMSTFYFIGIYHRYRYIPERALLGIFVGFLFNVFIVNFIKQYNFSRIASFYCWGLNSIFISGWRFIYQLLKAEESRAVRRRTVVVGKISDAVALNNILNESSIFYYEIMGCVEISQNVIRGREMGGIHVLGLVDELKDVIKEYSIDIVIMIGSAIPYSKVLSLGDGLGSMYPEFKLVPELKGVKNVKEGKTAGINIIDIRPGGVFGNRRSEKK